MMCILGGSETDGSICDCTKDGTVNLKQNPRGCCAYGMYWEQERYSSFSPLSEFVKIPDNVFYIDALLGVCKPPLRKYLQVYSESDRKDSILLNNYVATTTNHDILATVPCNGERETSLYRYEFKYNSLSLSDDYNAFIHASSSNSIFSDHNAKMLCMDRCTINTFDEPAFKSFSISIFKQESHDTTTWLGEQGTIDFRGNLGSGSYQDQSVDLKLAYFCKCLTTQAYVGDDGMFQPPKTPLAHLGIGNMKARYSSSIDYGGGFVDLTGKKCNAYDIEFEPAFDKFTHSKPGEYELAAANTKCVSSIVPKGGEIHLSPGSPHYRAGAVSYTHLRAHET